MIFFFLFFQNSSSNSGINRKHRNDATALSDGLEALEGFVIGLYQDTFTVLLSVINRLVTDKN